MGERGGAIGEELPPFETPAGPVLAAGGPAFDAERGMDPREGARAWSFDSTPVFEERG